jgi:hypothetical protein
MAYETLSHVVVSPNESERISIRALKAPIRATHTLRFVYTQVPCLIGWARINTVFTPLAIVPQEFSCITFLTNVIA